jgi:hypothetical protein
VSTRVGIELSPVACRIVELDGLDVVPGRPPATRVRSHAILPPSGPETVQRFASIGRQPVAVVVWGVRSDHRQVVVSHGSYEKMRAEALASVRAAGIDPRGTLADIAPASTTTKGGNRQTVVLALAHEDAVSAAIRPLVEARVRIRSVITPADALLGLARSRPPFAPAGPSGIEAYVALDATATCLALIRGGSLLGARELPWGYESPSAPLRAPDDAGALARRDDLAARLADELADFLMMVGARHEHDAVTQVSICGGLAELRTMTVSLMERLDVEVEALDSLFGIDLEHVPEPADEFRERAAELRLAWSAAADWRGPINLLRYRRRRDRRVVLANAAVVAGIAAGLGTGWAIEQSRWWQSRASAPIARTTPPRNVPPPSPPARTNAAPRRETPAFAVPRLLSAPSAAPSVSPPVSPPALRQSPAPAVVTAGKPPQTTALPAGSAAAPASAGTGSTGGRAINAPTASKQPATLPSAVSPPSVTRASVPATTPARVTSPVAAPAVAPARPAPVVQARPILTAPARPASGTPTRAATPVTPARQTPPSEASTSVPFAAVLGTILYSPDRKLAIVNDRIVGPGDEVNGARIVDITPTTVLFRDAQGRLLSLTLGVGARTRTVP